MPSWTLGQIMSEATARMGQRADLSASVCSFYANVAYQEVAEESNPSGLERIEFASISSGQSRIAPPENMKEMIALSYMTVEGSSSKTLLRASLQYIDAHGHFPSAKPTHFAEFRDWIELWPSPNSAFSIVMRYHSYATDMLATSQVPSLATPWRPAVMYLTEALLHEYVGNDEEGAVARARYLGYVNALHTSEARRQRHTADVSLSLPRRGRRLSG